MFDLTFKKLKQSTIKPAFATLLAIFIFPLISARDNVAASEAKIASSVIFSTEKPIPLAVKTEKVKVIVGDSRYEIAERKRAAQEKLEEEKSQRQARSREVLARKDSKRASAPSFAEKRKIVKDIAAKYSIDWKILEAVWEAESGKSWDRNIRSYAGARGPMQFLPSTFRRYADPGADINSALDSLHAGARYLASSGLSSGDVDRALYAYNHSTAYVKKVKRIASKIK